MHIALIRQTDKTVKFHILSQLMSGLSLLKIIEDLKFYKEDRYQFASLMAATWLNLINGKKKD